jgi:acetamidase/formamidase
MNYYLISLPRNARAEHSAEELTARVENLPGALEIVDGRNSDVLTVRMDQATAQQAAHTISFARIEKYYELNLLNR